MKNLFMKNVSGIKFCSFLLAVLFVFSCSKEESLLTMADETSDATLKSKVVVDEPIHFTGSTHFPAYAVKEHRVISPWEKNTLYCEATFTMGEGQNFELTTWEYFGTMLFREVTFNGKMTPSGIVKFSWPATWLELNFATGQLVGNTMNLLDQFNLHTGCVPNGPGINKGTWYYKGSFDGDNFYVSTHFMGTQEKPGLIGFYAAEPLIDGPIQFEFSIELVKVDCE